MTTQDLYIIAYTATSISILARFIFLYLLYTKKSVNKLSLMFSILNMGSSSMWIYYSVGISDTALTVRSICDLVLFTVSAAYIIRNRLITLEISA